MACACRPSPAPANRARHHCEKGAARPLWERLMLDNNSYDYRLTWPVNPAAPEDSNEAKTPFISHCTLIISIVLYSSKVCMVNHCSLLYIVRAHVLPPFSIALLFFLLFLFYIF